MQAMRATELLGMRRQHKLSSGHAGGIIRSNVGAVVTVTREV